MCCSVLQCVAVCCSVLQCVAVCCSVWRTRGASEDGALFTFIGMKTGSGMFARSLVRHTLQHTATHWLGMFARSLFKCFWFDRRCWTFPFWCHPKSHLRGNGLYRYPRTVCVGGGVSTNCSTLHLNNSKILRHTARHCKTLQDAVTNCNRLIVTYCNTLQRRTHCNTLQHTATHCTTLHLIDGVRNIRLLLHVLMIFKHEPYFSRARLQKQNPT